jgi:hypothetical protein
MNPFKFLSLTFGLYMSLVIVFGGGGNTSPQPTPTPTVFPRTTVQMLSPQQQIDRIAELNPTTTTTLAPLVIVDVSEDTECQQWLQTALIAGWPNNREILDRLGHIMWRESRCTPTADSGPDHGLTQLNVIHTRYMADLGWTFEQMKDPLINLRFAWILYSGREANGQCGWQPWSLSC